jgi:hypothetical protein
VLNDPNLSETTQKDWDDFWYNSEPLDDRSFEEIWEEMDNIEPLTPKTN